MENKWTYTVLARWSAYAEMFSCVQSADAEFKSKENVTFIDAKGMNLTDYTLEKSDMNIVTSWPPRNFQDELSKESERYY